MTNLGNLKGVISNELNQPVLNATVSIKEIVAISDSLGNYGFQDIDQGTYSITVSKEAYHSVKKSVLINGGEIKFKN